MCAFCAHVCTVSTSVITCLRVHILYRFTARLCVVWVSVVSVHVCLCTFVCLHICVSTCAHTCAHRCMWACVSPHSHLCHSTAGDAGAPGAGESIRASGPTPHPPEGPTWTSSPAAAILPAHPYRGDLPLNPRPIMLPYTPLLGLGGLPRGGQCASPGARAFGAPTPAGLSACRPQQRHSPIVRHQGSRLPPPSRGLPCTTPILGFLPPPHPHPVHHVPTMGANVYLSR